MQGYNSAYITGLMKSEKGLYQRVTRFAKGDYSALTPGQITEIRKIIDKVHKNANAFLDKAEKQVPV